MKLTRWTKTRMPQVAKALQTAIVTLRADPSCTWGEYLESQMTLYRTELSGHGYKDEALVEAVMKVDLDSLVPQHTKEDLLKIYPKGIPPVAMLTTVKRNLRTALDKQLDVIEKREAEKLISEFDKEVADAQAVNAAQERKESATAAAKVGFGEAGKTQAPLPTQSSKGESSATAQGASTEKKKTGSTSSTPAGMATPRQATPVAVQRDVDQTGIEEVTGMQIGSGGAGGSSTSQEGSPTTSLHTSEVSGPVSATGVTFSDTKAYASG
jgi:hypothetical protein